jgi:superfamily II DNA or RNA helicase
MKRTTLEIVDEVNVRFHGLDIGTRRKLAEALSYFMPHAFHVPAYKLGRWDGKMRFCDIGGRTYLNLLDKALPIVYGDGYEVELIDNREQHSFEFDSVGEDSYSHVCWPKGHTHAGEPIMLRDYQVEIINKYLENMQGVQSVSTGAGKTLVTAVLSHRIEKYGRSIVIVPTRDLVTQTERDYLNLGLDVGVFYGGRKEYDKTHTICTWQSLEALNKKSKNYDATITLDDFIHDVVCIIVDEAHGGKADVLKKLMSSTFANIPLRWGMTGTVPHEEYYQSAITATIGPVIHSVTAKELQDKEVLANLHIDILQTQEPPMTFRSFQEEYKWLVSSKPRLEWLASHITEKAKDGNTLVLVNRIETGKALAELMPDAIFVSGGMKSADRKEEYADVQTSHGKVIIATYGVASTGIDIPRIFNLYLIEVGKGFIRTIQSVGRGIRRAKDKDFVNVYDVCANTKYSKRHLPKRKQFYKDAQYPFTVTKVNY